MYRQTDRHTDRQTDMQAGRQTYRQAGRQTDKHTDKHTDRQIDRHKQTKKEVNHVTLLNNRITICVKLLRFALCFTFWEMLRFAVPRDGKT